MSKGKHTLGPWHVKAYPETLGVASETAGNIATAWCGISARECHVTISEAQANAHLIAAAPDLLAVVEACWESWQEAGELDAIRIPRMLRAAIAKARGEEP